MPKSSTASILLPLALAVAVLGAGCGPRYEGIIASAFDRNARRQGPAQPRLEREVSGEQDSGAPLEERSFLHLPDGQRPNHGVHSTWYPDGALRSAHTFDPERPTRMVWWHANGLVASEGMALLGVRTGRWRSWHENGEQESEGDYVGGQRVGAWVFYDEEGEWSERGRFVSGRRVGDWEFASRPGF